LKISSYKLAALFGALSLLATSLGAQVSPATVAGVVLQAGERTAIEGAEVSVVGSALRSMSTSLGEFRFDELEPGFVVLRVTHPGYRSRTDTIAVAPGERVEVRLSLSAEAIELEPINVVARRGTLGTGITGQYPGMTRSEIDAVLPRTRHLADLIRAGNFPGVRILEQSVPGVEVGNYCVEHPRARSGRFGPGSCISMNVYVDGRPVVNPGETLASLAPETVERFEILSPLDAASIYGGAGARGVILIETRAGTGVTERRLPTFTRDLAPVSLAIAFTRGSGSDLYDGAAFFTYEDIITNVLYVERSNPRTGVRASLRARPLNWFPEIEIAGFYAGGQSTATFQDGFGSRTSTVHDFNSLGFELAARPRLTKGERWDLSFLAGPVYVRESIDASAAAFPGADPGFGEVVARHMTRSWSTVGAMVGAEFEWVLSSSSSVMIGGRWRALTLGAEGDAITEEAVLAGEELLNLPQASRRNGRKSFEVGYVLRLGAPND